MRTETYEQTRERSERQGAHGDALAAAAFERGDTLTPEQRQALAHWSRWGSSGYPVRKLGRKWIFDHPAANGPMFATRHEAVSAWETLIAKWIRLDALHQHASLR